MVTRSASESAFIFRITLPRCAFTVISLMPSLPPTCLFNRFDVYIWDQCYAMEQSLRIV
jgi:hypothetical protein